MVYGRNFGIRTIKRVALLFVRLKTLDDNKVPRGEPVLFVCNHMEIYGPVAAMLHIPLKVRPWIINTMLDKELTVKSLESGIDIVFKALPRSWRRWLCGFAAPIVNWVLRGLDPIPVNRNRRGGVIQTMRMTVDALAQGENILIFPENPEGGRDGKYALDGVSEFYTGFSGVGRLYYKRTAKCLAFVPVYVSKADRVIRFGEPVRYDPDNDAPAEKTRIVECLQASMNELARMN